jgi:hypothetical protein
MGSDEVDRVDRFVLAGFLSTQEPFTNVHPSQRLCMADEEGE